MPTTSPELISARIREIAERGKRIQESAEFRANAVRLAEETREQLAVRAEVERLEYLVGSGIPRLFWAHLDAPERTPSLDAVEGVLSGGPSLVVLSGPTGVGKSFALAVATWRRRGRMLSLQDLFRVSSYAESEWRDLRSTPFLALDEAGGEHMTDLLRANLLSVLAGRLDDAMATAISTNLGQGEFAARFLSGSLERLRDRFRTRSSWVTVAGETLRKHWSDTDRDPGEEG